MRRSITLLTIVVTALAVQRAAAQVQVRVGDQGRTTYSEVHEALRDSTPAADSVLRILRATSSRTLWPIVGRMLRGTVPWDVGVLALTRIAELREPASADSVRLWRQRIADHAIPPPPATDQAEALPAFHAIELELARGKQGDVAMLNALLPRIPSGDYDLGDAWLFGRLDRGAADTIARRFLETRDQGLRIRYLTLLSFSTDTSLIPLLAKIFAAPDSFDLPRRIGGRASDGLLWIGTRASVQALLDARAAARARGTYADPKLGHADLDFLGNDSSQVISRTGRWLTEWVARLP
jgi:hypothetical protein